MIALVLIAGDFCPVTVLTATTSTNTLRPATKVPKRAVYADNIAVGVVSPDGNTIICLIFPLPALTPGDCCADAETIQEVSAPIAPPVQASDNAGVPAAPVKVMDSGPTTEPGRGGVLIAD